MEKNVIFRSRQEVVPADLNNMQLYGRQAVDHIVNDAITKTRRYTGFLTTKTNQAEVTVAPGRFYDLTGAIYNRETALVQSMVSRLPAVAGKIVSVVVYGNAVETDEQARDFEVVANPDAPLTVGQQVPILAETVAMTHSRSAILGFVDGTEAADPQPPVIPGTYVEIARIRLDPTQVVSVTMMTANRVPSIEELDVRVLLLELFNKTLGPIFQSIFSDIADLKNRLRAASSEGDMIAVLQDLARLKEVANLPDDYSSYAADHFLTPDESDWENDDELGYDALVEWGARFAHANADQNEIELFSANDPNAKLSASGLLLPKFDDVLKISTGEFHSDLGIAQFGFHEYALEQKTMRKERLRYGGRYTTCTNGGSRWLVKGDDPVAGGLVGFDTWRESIVVSDVRHHGARIVQTDYWWHDSWEETYWELEKVEHAIMGAQVAQTFLVASDTWATKLGFYITAKAANENIHVALCECENGRPNLKKVLAYISYPHANIVQGWNYTPIEPTFLKAGGRYAVALISNANHKVGMAEGQSYLHGTFFTSTDGEYAIGDLTKDMMIEVYGAKFAAAQVAIEFKALNLDGGIRAIDILAAQISTGAGSLVFEIQPGGAGDWIALTQENVSGLNGAPPLCRFRGRFVGSHDMHAGINLTGSRVEISRPKTAMKHVSTRRTLPASSDEIIVTLRAERFDDTPHDLTCKLFTDTTETPDTTTTKLIDAEKKIVERTFVFNLPAPVDEYNIIIEASTNSPASMFHIAERIDVAS